MFLAVLTATALWVPGLAAQPQEADFEGYLVQLSEYGIQNSVSLLSTDSCEEVRDGLYLVDDLETAQAMEGLGLAEYYEPNYRLELLDAGDYTTTQWNLLAVNAQAAWDHTDLFGTYDMRGTGVTVAVIDSGVYREHPDFDQDHILPYYDLAGTTNGVDGWHGTFVAGVIAAQVNNGLDTENGLGVDGVAPDVNILPICVTNGGNTTIAKLVSAMDYAIGQGVDVINLSIGGKNGSESLRLICQEAIDAGIILVAAAGNYKSGETQSSSIYMYPASYDGVVSVSACKLAGETVEFDSSYSYFNDQVTVSAPGSGVQSLYVDGRIATNQGTSFAAPVVTAMAAMAKQRCRDITPETFTRLLTASAVDLGDPGYDIWYGAGLVDIQAFAQELDRSYSISYHLGGEDASFPAGTEVRTSYALGSETIVLPEPVRAGYRFLGWFESEDGSGRAVTEIPAGTVGDRSFYAAWEETSVRYFAQYDEAGRMLAVERLPYGTDRIEDVTVEILGGAVLGRLFWLDESGAPLEAAQTVPLNSTDS